jgi:hypothetical protein
VILGQKRVFVCFAHRSSRFCASQLAFKKKKKVAQAAEEAAYPTGCALFFLGPRNRKMHFKNSDFGWVQI